MPVRLVSGLAFPAVAEPYRAEPLAGSLSALAGAIGDWIIFGSATACFVLGSPSP